MSITNYLLYLDKLMFLFFNYKNFFSLDKVEKLSMFHKIASL